MGAPKQKWASEEEAALKAGIHKYGLGKWSTILKDVEFSTVLRSRSNVDLKDKWRNLHCMTNGLGSRHRTTHRNSQLIPKRDEEGTSRNLVIEKDDMVFDETSVTQCKEKFEASGSIKQLSRLDDLILEAVTKLNEPRGSSRRAIAEYIEEHHWRPPDFESTLAAYLKLLTENRRLVKVRHYYRIAPKSSEKDPTLMHANGAKKNLSVSDTGKDGLVILTKAQIDAELEKMKSMTSKEAVAAAAQAVAEAEAAIAVAEAAVMEAEEAEAEAEAAYCVVDAAQKALNRDIISI